MSETVDGVVLRELDPCAALEKELAELKAGRKKLKEELEADVRAHDPRTSVRGFWARHWLKRLEEEMKP